MLFKTKLKRCSAVLEVVLYNVSMFWQELFRRLTMFCRNINIYIYKVKLKKNSILKDIFAMDNNK